MSFTYMSTEYFLLIPKIIDFFLFLILGVKIYRLKKYVLNQLYCGMFLLWALYMVTDLIIPVTGGNSYEWFVIDTNLWYLQQFAAICLSVVGLFATLIIKNGTQSITRVKIIIGIAIIIVFSYLITIDGGIYVLDSHDVIVPPESLPTMGIIRSTTFTGPFCIIGASGALLIIIYAALALVPFLKKIPSKELQTRMILLIVGILMLPTGMIYYILLAIFGPVNFYSVIVGHMFWALAPIFIWFSQKRAQKE
jgi:hypothetical protein